MKVPTKYLKRDGNWLLSMSSRNHECLTKFYHLFYSRPDSECTRHVYKKVVSREILSQVDDLALAIWICDDGTTGTNSKRGANSRNCLMLCAGALTTPEYQLIQEWLGEQGYSARIETHATKNKVKFYLNNADSGRLAERIRPHVPECMGYKLEGVRCL